MKFEFNLPVCVAVGVVTLFVVVSEHDPFCEQPHRLTFCNQAWDMPHGPHDGQHQPTQQQGRTITVTASTTATLGPVL